MQKDFLQQLEVFIMFDQGLQSDTHERWTTYLLSRSQLAHPSQWHLSPNICF